MVFFVSRRLTSYALVWMSQPYRNINDELPMLLTGLRIPFRSDSMTVALQIHHGDVPTVRAAFVALGFTEKEAF